MFKTSLGNLVRLYLKKSKEGCISVVIVHVACGALGPVSSSGSGGGKQGSHTDEKSSLKSVTLLNSVTVETEDDSKLEKAELLQKDNWRSPGDGTVLHLTCVG